MTTPEDISVRELVAISDRAERIHTAADASGIALLDIESFELLVGEHRVDGAVLMHMAMLDQTYRAAVDRAAPEICQEIQKLAVDAGLLPLPINTTAQPAGMEVA